MTENSTDSSTPVQDVVMRRFWLFGGEEYYAAGGCNDFRGSFDSVEEAIEYAKHAPMFKDSPRGPVQWSHIFDSKLYAVVAWSKTLPYGAEKTPVFDA